ncbi:MAG TPA: FtsX-like permease family protein [Euryarchaeota archaeon]|nr:FtsX-like permease family protein [Euryarchaeota archaeon]
MLLRKRAIVAAVLSLVIFSSSVSVLMGIGEAPRSFLGNEDVFVISSRGTASVINSRIDLSLADRLLDLEIAEVASSEIFSFSEIDGNAVVIRGVDFSDFMTVEGAQLLRGTVPAMGDLDGALLGHRLAQRLDAGIGDRIPLVGAFDPSIAEVEIKGMIESGSGVDDELIVSLPVAQTLSQLPDTQASIIRVIGDIATLEEMFASGTAKFSVYDLSIERSEVAVGSSVEVSFLIKNWGDADGSAEVRLVDTATGTEILGEAVEVKAGNSEQVCVNFSSSAVGEHELTVFLEGDLPQNISGSIEVRPPFLVIVAPEIIPEYHAVIITVLDHYLSPVSGAEVTIDDNTYFTDDSGRCSADPIAVQGAYNITASLEGFEPAYWNLSVVDSESIPPEAVIETIDLQVDPSVVKVRENCTITIIVQNLGNSSGNGTVLIEMGGIPFRWQFVELDSLEVEIVNYSVSFSTTGHRTFTSGAFSRTLTVESTYVINPDIVQLLLRYGSAGSIDPSRGSLIYNTAKISEGNILIVIVSLAVLSATLVTLGVSIAFMKEINDNIRVVGILRSIGASSRQLLGMIFKESLVLSMPAAAIGLAGGVLLALAIDASGRLIAFGHVVSPLLDPSYLFLAVLGSVAICVGSSLIAGLSVSRKVAIRMIRGTEEDICTGPSIEELLRDDA